MRAHSGRALTPPPLAMPSARDAFSAQLEAADLGLHVKPYAGEIKAARNDPAALDGLTPAALVLAGAGTQKKKGRYLMEALLVTDTPGFDEEGAQDDAIAYAEALADFLTARRGRRWKGAGGTGYRTEYGSDGEGVSWETLAVTPGFAIVRVVVDVAEV